MATVQSQKKPVGKPNVKKEKPPASKKSEKSYCILCRKPYLKHEAQEHVHGMLHHRELEAVLGKDSFHECQACKASSMGLNEYAQHISTPQHKAKLKSLMLKKSIKVSVHKTLSKETVVRILERNRTLKKEERKERKKKRKKIKQESGPKHAQTPQGMAKKKQQGSKPAKQKKSQQEKTKNAKKPVQAQQKGNSKAFAQNKENRMSLRLRSQSQRQNQGGGLPSVSREHPGGVWHHPHPQIQYNQSAHHLRFDDNFPISTHMPQFNHQFSEGRDGSSQTYRPYGPNTAQGGCADMPNQSGWPNTSQYGYGQYSRETDKEFTCDHLPPTGAIIFDHAPDRIRGSSQPNPGQDPQSSAAPASASKCLERSLDAGSIQDIDISAILWQIRRALGVREPCRADREARSQKQSGEAGVQQVDHSTVQQAAIEKEPPLYGPVREETESYHNTLHNASRAVADEPSKTPAQSLQASTNAPASPLDVCASRVKAEQRSPRTAKEKAQQAEEIAELASDSDGQSNSREQEAHGGSTAPRLGTLASLNRSMGKATSAEPNLTAARRIRNVSESRRAEGNRETGRKATLQKLLSSKDSKSKVNWREMYQEVIRKKQEEGKGMPRFGIEFVNPQSDQEGSTQVEDFPLSEGFQWELELPDDPPPHSTTDNDSLAERQADSMVQEPSEQPGATPGYDSSVPNTAAGSVKVEPSLDTDSDGHLGGNCNAKKKHKADDDIGNMGPSGKKKRKKKSNKDQDQMDQLLAVSLREEELSHSLEDVDSSLIQARNALQAAYTEVQRLLLLKQQFTAEVNNLRAKRILILQEMQDGYSGVSSAGEKASSPTTGAAATASPRPSSLSSPSSFAASSIQQPPAAASLSSIGHPHPTSPALTNMLIKKEMFQASANERASEPARVVTSNAAAPQMSSGQVLPLVPPVLLPSLLLTSNSPTHVASVLRPPRARSSTSANTVQLIDSGPEELEGGNIREHVRGRGDKAAPTSVPEVDQDEAPAAEDDRGGDESDSSVEMMEPSSSRTSLEVIAIEESDNENEPETASNGPGHPELTQKSVCVDYSTASTQTGRLKTDEPERKIQVPAVPVKDAKIPPEPGDVAEDEEPSLGTFEGHTGSIQGLQVHDGLLYTCSADNTARAYSLTSRECQAVFDGHTNKVNCLLVSTLPNMPARLYTGSSDHTIRCYSIKSKKCLEQILLPDRVLCLHIAWKILYVGLANGSVVSYDLKTLKQLDVFECHSTRGVSCLGTAQEGARRVLLVGSYDSTISVRDAKNGLLLRSLEGHTKTVLCMKVVNDLVFSGSSDTSVHAHNIHTGELVRIYKGHGHAVTSIAILGKVMVTACVDKLVRVYELQSHDRLQVYGGHSDMVMCMAIHKSVIYTGCYDGSVQAVKLNLMKNYRCWWMPCSLIFGMEEHLVGHLLRDHSNPQLQTVKCRWRDCKTFFSSQEAVKQELPEHMRNHVEQDGKVDP